MRALLSLVLVALAVVALPVGGPQAARADEAPQDDSAASKAFRDAWWAETGGGNLTQALDHYAKAADAQGPASVRARALYRRAVVLQRIGKTEEAIRALERLAKDFPGETDLQAQARARLTEWTAVDLRSSFSEWFKRYQYSPEFQAKIVDLVLRLGAGGESWVPAKRELLTIGEPAIPALRAHLASPNPDLRARAVQVLLHLGVVPDEVTDVAWTYYGGQGQEGVGAWRAVLSLPPERGAALAAQVKGEETKYARALRAALRGPAGAIEWLSTPATENDSQLRRELFWALTSVVPADATWRDRIAALALLPGQPDDVRGTIANWVVARGGVTPDLASAWAVHGSAHLRAGAWKVVDAGLLSPAQGWSVVHGALKAHGPEGSGFFGDGGARFLKLLDLAPWPQTRDDLLELGGRIPSLGQNLEPTARYREILAHVYEQTPDDHAATRALREWRRGVGKEAVHADTLLRWVRVRPGTNRWREALDAALNLIDADRADAWVELLVDPELPSERRATVWSRTLTVQPGAAIISPGALIISNPARRDRLLEWVRARTPAPGQSTVPEAEALAKALVQHGQLPEVFELWLKSPERISAYLLGHLRDDIGPLDNLAALRKAWVERWPGWSKEQRMAALWGVHVLKPKKDADLVAFLRAQLRAGEVPEDGRISLLLSIAPPDVADLKAAYDLSNPAKVDEAVQWWFGPHDPPTPVTVEAFEAVKLALRPNGDPGVAHIMRTAFGPLEAVQRPLIAALLEHRTEDVRYNAVSELMKRSSAEDEDLWLRALRDASHKVRNLTAQYIQRVPTENVKRALVGALDDPHPDVRAAALASLDNLQKAEDLKARWRERVK